MTKPIIVPDQPCTAAVRSILDVLTERNNEGDILAVAYVIIGKDRYATVDWAGDTNRIELLGMLEMMKNNVMESMQD